MKIDQDEQAEADALLYQVVDYFEKLVGDNPKLSDPMVMSIVGNLVGIFLAASDPKDRSDMVSVFIKNAQAAGESFFSMNQEASS